MRNNLSITEVGYSDLENVKMELIEYVDEVEEASTLNFKLVLSQLDYLKKQVTLLEQGLIDHKKQIIEQNEHIIYLEDRLTGQELCNVKNEKDIRGLKDKFKKFFFKKKHNKNKK